MSKNYQGFIFLMTLMMTTIISLLVLTGMQHLLLFYKVINKQEETHHHFYQLEQLALQLASTPREITQGPCFIDKESANSVVRKLLQQEGCVLKKNNLNYRYYIEDLGEFPCLVVYKNGQKRATHHRRISIAQMEEGLPNALMQLRLISIGSLLHCLNEEHTIALGVSSWRYLSSVDDYLCGFKAQ